MPAHHAQEQLRKLIALISQDKDAGKYVEFVGDNEQILPSVFDLTGFALATIGVANLAAAKLKFLRANLPSISVSQIDTLDAVAAFSSEALLIPKGWTLPFLWDPIAGNYKAKDGWIRLHTNYEYHRDAALRALDLTEANREVVEQKVAKLSKFDIERAVISQGGCAAVQYTRDEWKSSLFGRSTLAEKALTFSEPIICTHKIEKLNLEDAPLKGIRVLDLTRVIAGPECTKFLAAFGAEVLRIDPPDFVEVGALLPDTTIGKKRAFLNLKTAAGKAHFEKLVVDAHVIVSGLRADALKKLGLSIERLRQLNPSLVVAEVNAYGWHSEWSERRGFDSLVQMSSGISALGAYQAQASKAQLAPAAIPAPMPVQALDHGAGFLLAAGICEALSILFTTANANRVQTSLIGVANFLFESPRGHIQAQILAKERFDASLVMDESDWGPILRVKSAIGIKNEKCQWRIPAGRLGADAPNWS